MRSMLRTFSLGLICSLFIVSGVAAQCVVSVPTDRWRGEYYNNVNLTGSPLMVRDDSIDGFGGLGKGFGGSPAPACGLGEDAWSARLTRTVNFPTGLYRFFVTIDTMDKAALYVDGQLRLSFRTFHGDPLTTREVDVLLTAGAHEVKLEYADYDGPAVIDLYWSDTGCIRDVSADRWRGEYFNNTTLTGSSVQVRDDGDSFLNLNFGDGSPNPSSACVLGADNFSARWTRTVNFAKGVYRFTATVDDGVRLYIDGQLKIDAWVLQGPTTYTADVFLTAGNHEVKLEYFEATGSALISLNWTTLVNCLANVPAGQWRGEYFNNTTLTGDPEMVRPDGDGFLNFNWGDGSPGSVCGQGVDNFSARWTRTVNFAAGAYRFIVTADNGVRLYVDGQLKIDQWADLPPNTYTADVSLSAGDHEIKLEFVEYGGAASVSLFWGDPNCLANVPAGQWRGEYFNNTTLTGFPAMVRNDGAGSLNFNFGNGSPGAACGLGVDNFSARWTRTANFATSTYRFTVTVDDGMKLYVDGQIKIDKWFSQGATTYTADVALTAGAHEVKLEYFESGGPAIALLSWADATGVNCLPNTPLPLISSVPQTGGREIIASTAPSQAPKRCGQKSSD